MDELQKYYAENEIPTEVGLIRAWGSSRAQLGGRTDRAEKCARKALELIKARAWAEGQSDLRNSGMASENPYTKGI